MKPVLLDVVAVTAEGVFEEDVHNLGWATICDSVVEEVMYPIKEL